MRFATALALAAFAAAPARAQTVFGLGQASCAEYRESLAEKPEVGAMMMGWAQGFMAGLQVPHLANGEGVADLDPKSMPVVMQSLWLTRWCAENPTRTFGAAATTLYRQLRTDQGIGPKPAASKSRRG